MPTKYILLVSLLSLVLVNVPFARSECYDTNNVFDPTQRYISSCPQTNDLPKTDPQLSIVSDTSPEKGTGDMIQIMFSCDEKKPELCEKGRRGFQNAAKYITDMIDFKAPVVLNATFAQICGTFIKCDPKKPPFPLGAAGPDRLVPLKDDDGETRLYPQALVKQLQLANHPEYSSVDIQAVFNSEASTFWFRGDPEIGKDQVDFELVVVHEVIHGLGFLSSWDEYINVDNPTGLTPFPPFLIRPDDSSPVNGTITFTGFQEFPFDRFLTLTADNTPLSSITKRINQFSGTVFANDKEFDKAFINSEQYTECQRMLLNSATRNSIAFKISDDESYPIETSLSPFRSGSSMGHLDFDTFNNTLDFLMRWKAPRQVTLDDLTSVNGNNPDYTSPMGPKTLEILEALGYSLKDNPKPLKKNKDLENLKSNTGSINTNTLSLLSLLSFIVTILIL